MNELHRFAPGIPAILYHGTPADRAVLREGIMTRSPTNGSCKTVVTSFEMIMRDRKFLCRLPWKYIIVDEVCFSKTFFITFK
jgi:ATP-dependent DNA helicase